ncbi:hypothetical protein [Aquisalimonas asiatica]|uniref:hypothetical protein n=1 Tax=Aquisalimonas asiatica TaxID=406100 RepID=UPI000B8978DC|nr:hypothetical protein [Aquisalimonas asiatica]
MEVIENLVEAVMHLIVLGVLLAFAGAAANGSMVSVGLLRLFNGFGWIRELLSVVLVFSIVFVYGVDVLAMAMGSVEPEYPEFGMFLGYGVTTLGALGCAVLIIRLWVVCKILDSRPAWVREYERKILR